jgi:Tol biopolymer transport system component
VITACTNARSSGSWGRDDTILFAPVFNSPLVRVSASGGAATDLNLERTSTQRDAFFSPVWLPDGQRFLVVRFPFDDSAAASSGVYLGQLGSPTLTPVVPGRVSEVTLDGGALIMRRGEELISQPFDIATGRVSGSPHTLAQRVIAMSAAGGTLVYHAPPQGASLGSRITWVSRDRGATLFETGTPGSINDLRLSRDGRVLAATRIGEFGLAEIWTYDLKRNVDQRVSSGGTIVPVWSDDPRYVTGLGPDGVRRFDLTALGAPPQLILPTTSADTTLDWSPDGKHVALRLISTLASPRPRVMVYPVGGADTKGNGDPVTIAEPSGPGAGIVAFSPNGNWIAYTDAQSGGRPRVYVSAFPLRGDRVTVSSMDATHMRWRRDGRELFILTGGPQFGTSGSQFGSARIFAIDVIENDKGIDFGPARELFTLNKILRGTSAFDVSPDGQQFVFIIPSDPDRTPLTVIRDRVSR